MRIIYIDIDSLRPDHLGVYGYPRPTSPNLDALAKEAVVFEHCHTSDAPCLPSRTALFSGRFGIHTGVVTHGGTAARMRYPGDGHATDPRYLPLPMVLSRAGVRTITFTTFAQRHLAWHFYAGWDEVHKHSNKNGNETADEVTAAVLPWLQAHGREESYFLHINFWDPHGPFRTPASYGNPLADSPPPSWPDEDTIRAHRESYGPHSARDVSPFAFQYDLREYPRYLNEIRDRRDFVHWIDGYDVGIRYVDEHVGRIVDTLMRLGVWEETALIVSADHGDNQGELNIYGDHQTADEWTTRVPLLIRWPGIPPRRVEDLVYQLDLAPTLVELLGLQVPSGWDGQSFAPLLRGQGRGRDHLVVGQGAWTCQRGVRKGPWLLIRTLDNGMHPFPEAMLFHLESDPHETVNLVDRHPEVVRELDHLLTSWWHAQMAKASWPEDPLLVTLREGGPYYIRGQVEVYLRRLEATGRGWAAARIRRERGLL